MRYFARCEAIIPHELRDCAVIIAGAGSIGSNFAYLASKCYAELHIVDFDNIEAQNIHSQFYGKDDLKKPKVETLKEHLSGLAIGEIHTYVDKVPDVIPNVLQNITHERIAVVSAVDKVRVRKWLFDSILIEPRVLFWLDGRTGGENVTVIGARLDDKEAVTQVNSLFFGDSEVYKLPCGGEMAIHSAMFCATMLLNALLKLQKGVKYYRVDANLASDYINIVARD